MEINEELDPTPARSVEDAAAEAWRRQQEAQSEVE